MSLKEKFQVTVPYQKTAAEGEGWTPPELVHTGVTQPGEGSKFNQMPVGYDATCARDNFAQGFGGDTDVSGGVNANSLDKGYQRLGMKPDDDMYTGEHVDHFYGEAVDENGKVGFIERNNYLDRL